jgi:hypothetical protein
LLVSLPTSKDERATSVVQHHIAEFQADEITNSAAGAEQQVKDGIGPHVLAQFNLSQ